LFMGCIQERETLALSPENVQIGCLTGITAIAVAFGVRSASGTRIGDFMKRLLALLLLAIASIACIVPAQAQRMSNEQAARRSRKDAKKQQKMARKSAKQQQKAMKRSVKANRKATNKANKQLRKRHGH
jgi:hypothetical protein